VTEYVPVAVVDGTWTVNVDMPEVIIEVELRPGFIPLGAVGVSETAPANPLREFTVIVEVAEDPASIVIGLGGDAEIEKFGVVERAKLVVTGLPKPVTRS